MHVVIAWNAVPAPVRTNKMLIQFDRNSEVSIKTAGWIHEKVEAGAMVEISAKYSIIPIKIINRKDELCSLIGQVGLSCPIEAGAVAFDKTTTIPNRMIPSVRCLALFSPFCLLCVAVTRLKQNTGNVSHQSQSIHERGGPSHLLGYRSEIQVSKALGHVESSRREDCPRGPMKSTRQSRGFDDSMHLNYPRRYPFSVTRSHGKREIQVLSNDGLHVLCAHHGILLFTIFHTMRGGGSIVIT